MIIQTINQHIEELSELRILQQKEDWQEEYQGSDTVLFAKTKQYLEEHINQDLFLFAEVQNNVIVATCGVQLIHMLPQCCDNGKYGYVCNVYTKQEYRKKGIQTRLFFHVMDFIKKQNIQRVWLSSDNPVTVRIYKKFGFKENEWAYIWKQK